MRFLKPDVLESGSSFISTQWSQEKKRLYSRGESSRVLSTRNYKVSSQDTSGYCLLRRKALQHLIFPLPFRLSPCSLPFSLSFHLVLPSQINRANFLTFWKLFNYTLARVYNSRLITIASVNGYSPAGGTGLALSCDYRIATEDVVMGLNEVEVGIPVPEYWCKLMEEVGSFES